jgi:hypothetical protein
MTELHSRALEQHRLDLVKVAFRITDKRIGETETMWAEVLGPHRYELDNIPLLVDGVSLADIVDATIDEGRLKFSRVVEHKGHSTYRLMLSHEVVGARFEASWTPLEAIGCRYEAASPRFVAVDVPPHTDIYEAYDLIEKGQQDGLWLFEEGHVGHPLVHQERNG